MQSVLFVLCQLVRIFLIMADWAMFLRMIFSLLGVDGEESRMAFFLICVTEPLIMPVRALLHMFGLRDDLPIDVGFFVTALLISAALVFLPPIAL